MRAIAQKARYFFGRRIIPSKTRGVAPGCFPLALSAPKPRINRGRIPADFKVGASHFFPGEKSLLFLTSAK
jgi:hypothetical protein